MKRTNEHKSGNITRAVRATGSLLPRKKGIFPMSQDFSAFCKELLQIITSFDMALEGMYCLGYDLHKQDKFSREEKLKILDYIEKMAKKMPRVGEEMLKNAENERKKVEERAHENN